jgi:hypothetical protein
MDPEKKEMSILVINEKGQLSVVDIDMEEREIKEYVFNKIGDCSNGMGICLGFDPDSKDENLGW